MAMFETLVQLFAAFAKIGFTSFGGTSMIPLIMDEMSSHGWMTDADLTNLIAIAEMTPGSLGVNAATFAGTKTAGMPGGVFAVLGVLSPTLTLTLLAAAFFQKFRTSKVMSYIMKIVKPVCIGMVLGVLVGLCRQTCITEAGMNIENMESKSKKDYAYTVLDVKGNADSVADKIRAGEAVISVRVIK